MSTDQRDDDRLQQRLRALAGERQPAGDLWPAIVAALPARRSMSQPQPTPRAPRARQWPWLGAGLAAAIAMALLLSRMWTAHPAHPDPAPALADAMHEADSTQVLIDAYADVLELARRDDMETWLLSRPGARERMAAARELDASMAGLAAALRLEPESQLLRRLMHQTLQQRIGLMRRLDA